jgi:DNA-binding IclR family transcriptional regulator
MGVKIIWRGDCDPHTVPVRKGRIATMEDVANYHREGSWVEYTERSAPIVQVAVGIMDGHRTVVYGMDAEGNEIAAKSLSVGQSRALDRADLSDVPRHIAVLIGMSPV